MEERLGVLLIAFFLLVILMEKNKLIMDFLIWSTHEEDLTLCKKGVMSYVEQRIPVSRDRMEKAVSKYLETLEQ
jgi:hypothetical protein